MTQAAPSYLITPEFRVSFPNVFKAQAPLQAGGKSKYGITMLFAKDADLTKLKAAAQLAAQEFFGNRLTDATPVDPKDPTKGTKGQALAKRLRSPFRDQGEKIFEGYVAGNVFVNATSERRPGLVDANVQPIIDESQFYAGCHAIAEVNAFVYDQAGNVGVAFGVNNIQKVRDGEPLGGRPRPEDVFKPATPAAGTAGDAADAAKLFG